MCSIHSIQIQSYVVYTTHRSVYIKKKRNVFVFCEPLSAAHHNIAFQSLPTEPKINLVDGCVYDPYVYAIQVSLHTFIWDISRRYFFFYFLPVAFWESSLRARRYANGKKHSSSVGSRGPQSHKYGTLTCGRTQRRLHPKTGDRENQKKKKTFHGKLTKSFWIYIQNVSWHIAFMAGLNPVQCRALAYLFETCVSLLYIQTSDAIFCVFEGLYGTEIKTLTTS